MPKTDLWLIRTGLYVVAPLMLSTGLLITDSPLLAGIGLFIGFLAHLALQDHRATRTHAAEHRKDHTP